MTKMTTVARRSPVRNERTPRAVSSRTRGFRTLLKRRIKFDCRFSRAISFIPYFLKRVSASAWIKPSGRVSSSRMTVSVSARAFSSN